VPGALILLLVGACGGETRFQPPPPAPRASVSRGHPPPPAVQLWVHPVPKLFPSEPNPVKEIRLDAVNVIVDIAPGIKFAGRAFGGTVPGPTLRVRVGDRLRFVIANRTDETVGSVAAAPIDLALVTEAAPLPGAASVRPGHTMTLEVTPPKPGLFVYRATSTGAAVTGMYGLIVVDDVGGRAPADREYAVVLGELHLRPDPSGRSVAGVALHVADEEAARSRREPSHVLFNGRTDAVLDEINDARPGERLRLFVASARAREPAVLLVQGAVRAVPKVPLPAGGTAVLELVTTAEGPVTIVDDEPAYVGVVQGTLRGLFGRDTAAEAAARNRPPPRTAAERRERGAELHRERCLVCHEPPAGIQRLAPELAGVSRRRPREWLIRWLTDPLTMQASDPEAQKLLKQWNNLPMPDVGLSEEQASWILEFLKARELSSARRRG
jgi:nitrite reductase (NO-forming)